MSDWGVDSIADNPWSSFDEVAWIECESKGDHIVPDPRNLRGSSFSSVESLPKSADESSRGGQKIPDQTCRKLRKLDHPDADIKGQGFTDLEAQESGYNIKDRVISPSRGVWRDYLPGSPPAVLPLSALSRGDFVVSTGPEVEPKKETFRGSFEAATGMCKGDSGYHVSSSDTISSSCHFLMSPPGVDLEFLAESHEEVRRDNLLEYGWGNTNNLDDMAKFFLNNGCMLSQGLEISNDRMLWEPPSPTLEDSLENMQQPGTVPVSPEFVQRGFGKHFEADSDLSTSKTALTNLESRSGEEWSVPRGNIPVDLENSCLPTQIDNYIVCRKRNSWESQETNEGENRDLENMEDEASHAPNEIEKCQRNKAKRHGPRSRRLEENSRKAISGRKLALNMAQAKKSPLMYVPVVSIPQDSAPCAIPRFSPSEPISPMQCLQPVPYVHAGFGFPAHDHLPVVVPSPVMPQQLQLQGHPVFIGYQPQYIDIPKHQQSKSKFDFSSQSPTASSTMTPQEKIEKLRWRQKMQARLAIEQQQQQLINQRLIPDQTQCGRQHNHQIHPQMSSSEEALGDSVRFNHSRCADPLIFIDRSVLLGEAVTEDGDESLAASVLHQLLNIASKMDTRTRLCLRDGFHRLAGNAMQRRAAGDTPGSNKKNSEPINRTCTAESSSSSEQSYSQRLLAVDDIVETETNPMDRFIAQLLFHKRSPPSVIPLHTMSAPCSVSEISQRSSLHPNAWACTEAIPSSCISPATQSSVSGDFGSSKVPNNSLELPATDTSCDKQIDRLAFSSVVSGLQLEKILKSSANPAKTPLQHLEERESDMVDTDTVITAVVTS